MANFFEDFNRTDATTLGNGWTVGPSSTAVRISGNTAVFNTTSNAITAFQTTQLDTADMRLTVIMSNVTGEFAITGRLSTAGDYYELRSTSAGTMTIRTRISGTAVTRATSASTYTLAAGDTLMFELIGSTIKGYRNGTEMVSWTGTEITGTGFGFRSTASAQLTGIDSYNATDVGGSTPDTTPPTAPTNVTATDISQDGFTLTWTASTDSVGVAQYVVYLNNITAGGTNGTTTTIDINGLTPDTDYVVAVFAYDAAENESPVGTPGLIVHTLASTVIAPFKVGTVPVKNLRRGTAQVLRVYRGTGLVWGTAPVPEDSGDTSGALYGPTGTNVIGLAAPTASHDVAATWTAISSQITTCQGHPGVCAINVLPGTLPVGNGFGSGSTGVIQNVGSVAKRIIVQPKNGWGTVSVAAGTGIAFVGMKGVFIDRINMQDSLGVIIRNCETVGIGHTKISRFLCTANQSGKVDDVDLVEVVFGPVMQTGVGYDRSEFKTATNATSTMNNVRWRGCYLAPHWKPEGSSAHNDTIQIEAIANPDTGEVGGTRTNFSFSNTIVFRSADQCIQSAGTSGGTWNNSAFFGNDVTSLRYPLYPGGDPATLDNTLNGTWSSIAATNCVVGGNIGDYTFTTSTGNRSSKDEGIAGWTTDTSLETMSLATLNTIAPYPTDTRLAQLWA